MIAKLTPDLVRELERAGGQPLPVEDPSTNRIYAVVDLEQYDVIRRGSMPDSGGESWTNAMNERRCALIHKKFSQGIDAEENRELTDLQEKVSSYRKHAASLPYDVLDTLQTPMERFGSR